MAVLMRASPRPAGLNRFLTSPVFCHDIREVFFTSRAAGRRRRTASCLRQFSPVLPAHSLNPIAAASFGMRVA
jgi:hypothetical protein